MCYCFISFIIIIITDELYAQLEEAYEKISKLEANYRVLANKVS